MTLREVIVPSKPPASIPPLEAGDRLTRDEFERRYDGEAFPGLWLDGQAMMSDPAANLRVLQQGLDSPEHQAFIAQLKSGGRKP